MKHHLVAALAAAGLSWACGANAAPAVFAYALFDHGDGGLAAWRMDAATGALELVATVPVRSPSGLATDASHRFLYTVDNGDGEFPAEPVVVAYRIEPWGAPAEIGRLAAPPRWSKGGRVLAASDRFVYVLLNDSSTGYAVAIMVYRIGETGTLSEVGYSGAGISCCLQFFALDAAGQSAFMDSGGSTRVMGYRTNADGTLSGSGQAPTTGVPTAGGLHPSGRWLLVGGGDLGSTYVASYAAGPGTLEGPVSSINPGFNPHAIAVDPAGRFLAVAGLGALVSYRVDEASGRLRRDMLPLELDEPHSMAFDPGGRFLYVATFFELTVMAVEQRTGVLHPLSVVAPPGVDVRDILMVAVP